MTSPTTLPSHIDDALDAYKTGKPVKDCAAIAGVSRRTFSKYIRQAGMPQRRAVADSEALEQAISAYINGLTVEQCAKMCGIGRETFRQHLIRREVPLRDRFAAHTRRKPTPDGLIDDYLGGLSVKAVAAKFGLERNSVYRMLREAGINGRDRSEALQLRWQRASPAERRKMLEKTHASQRGRSVPEHVRSAIATAKAGTPLSPNETRLGALLSDLGHDIEYGVPCGIYNIDVVVAGTVAVEIFGGNWHETGRHRARFAERSRHILDAGFSLVIVWVKEGRYPLGVECAKHLGTLVEIARGHPSIRRQHWVIRGDGHFLTVREDDGGQVPFVSASGRRSD